MRITRLKAINFKKHKNLDINFNKDLNVIIGENESGKSTILQAIDILLSGSRNKVESIGLEYLFNDNAIQNFFEDKSFQNLPKLKIELYFDNINDGEYWGTNNTDETTAFGISLTCEARSDLSQEISQIINKTDQNFPFEFYTISFLKFGGAPYLGFTRKFKHVLIDHSSINNEYATNMYIKTLYTSSVDIIQKNLHTNQYRKLKSVFKEDILIDLNRTIPNNEYEFSLKGHTKFGLAGDLTIVENNIDILHRGKGRQCFIKTEFALSKNESELDFVLLEEPENHLSHLNMHKLIERINQSKNKQLFIATHSNLISARLDLRNAIFLNISNDINLSLKDLSETTAKFFIKAPNKNLLEFILSTKVLLVEGDAEFILMEKFFEIQFACKPDQMGIHIISVGGISFKRYIEVANLLKIRTAIIRDNDGSFNDNITENYQDHISEHVQIFADMNDDLTTFEISLYSLNNALCDSLFEKRIKKRSVIEYMLAEKTESAYELLNTASIVVVPEYILSAFSWLVKN